MNNCYALKPIIVKPETRTREELLSILTSCDGSEEWLMMDESPYGAGTQFFSYQHCIRISGLIPMFNAGRVYHLYDSDGKGFSPNYADIEACQAVADAFRRVHMYVNPARNWPKENVAKDRESDRKILEKEFMKTPGIIKQIESSVEVYKPSIFSRFCSWFK